MTSLRVRSSSDHHSNKNRIFTRNYCWILKIIQWTNVATVASRPKQTTSSFSSAEMSEPKIL